MRSRVLLEYFAVPSPSPYQGMLGSRVPGSWVSPVDIPGPGSHFSGML